MCIAKNENDISGVNLIRVDSASDSLNALKSGKVDGAALTLDEVLRANAEGLDLVVVLVFDVSAGADKVIARDNIQSLSELKGKKFGVEYSALGALVVSKLLEQSKLSLNEIEIVSLPVSDQLNYWKNGQIDVAISYQPYSTALIKNNGHEIFSSREMPEMIFDVLAIKRSVLDKSQKNIESLLKAYFKVIEVFQHNRYDFYYKMSSCMDVSVSDVEDAFKELAIPDLGINTCYLIHEHSKFKVALDLLKKQMVEWNIIKSVDVSDIYSGAYLPKMD
jgi:NitT/TauT family transport system substrate-binding protein